MKTIIKKELLDHLQSIQFFVLLAISVLLFTTSGIISVKKYKQEISTYNQKVTNIHNNPSTTYMQLLKQPNPLLFLSESGEKFSPAGYTLKPKGVLNALPSAPRNFKLPEMPELDWSFIIKIVFSLYVLLLGYNSVSGEKAQGTLRLILSNQHGRISFLAGKYCAILLTVFIPLIIGVLINLIILGIFIPKILIFSNIIRILLMLLLGMVYLSVFAFLSLLFSSLMHQSSLVLLSLLAVWVFFTIIIPNISGILSRSFSDVPSEYQTAKQVGPMIQQQVWAGIGEVRKKAEKGELTTEEEVKRETNLAFEEGQQDLIKHYKSYENAMKRREQLAQILSRFSPTALFQYSSENIANSGKNRENQFLKDGRAYSLIYDDYILNKVGQLVGTSMWSFSTTIALNGKSVYISSPEAKEYEGDKSDFPVFTESKINLAYSLRLSLLDLAALLLWNIILALFAFIAFIRCDVR